MKVSFPIKAKLFLLIALLLLFTMGSTSLFLLGHQKRMLTEELQKRGMIMLHMLSEESKGPLLSGDDLLLHKFVAEVKRSEGVLYALVCDQRGLIQAHTDLSRVGKQLVEREGIDIRREGDLTIRVIREGGEEVIDFTRPILYGGIEVGRAKIGISAQLVAEALVKARNRMLWLTLLSLALGTGGSMLLATLLARPVRRLMEGAREIGSGNLNFRIQIRSHDELGELTRSFNEMAESLWKKKLIEEAFGRYVTKQVAQEIMRHPEQIELGGKRQEVSVLFADIRGFTRLAERNDPEEVVRTLNSYLTLMTRSVFKHEGTLDKFLGDAIMAVFGAPIFYPDHALRAIAAALDIQEEIRALNKKRTAAGMEAVEIGIGINAGEVVTGNIGSEERMEYTVIGDNVNIAARLEDLAGAGQILISESIFQAVEGKVRVRPLDLVCLRGREKALPVYEVSGLAEVGSGNERSHC
jgi:adenylate cyclase